MDDIALCHRKMSSPLPISVMVSIKIYTIDIIVGNDHSFIVSFTEMSKFPSGIQPFGQMHSPLSYSLL